MNTTGMTIRIGKPLMWAGLVGLSLLTPVSVSTATTWPGIAVDVKADQAVTTTQSLEQRTDGFQQLSITSEEEQNYRKTATLTSVDLSTNEKPHTK